MVRWPEGDLYSAAAMTSLISLMPARTALKETNSACVTRAMRRASVVLPQPGGPQNSIEPMLSLSICVRSGFPGPRSFSWPMNSSRVRGRMRSASGWLAAGTSESAGEAGSLENRLMDSLSLNRLPRKGKWDNCAAGACQLSVGEEKDRWFQGWFGDTRGPSARQTRAGCREEPQRAGPLKLPRGGVALAGGFVEDDRGGGSGVEGLNAAGHRNVDAGVGGALDFFGEACAFVANQKSDGLAPVDFPGSEKRGVGSRWLVRLGMVKTRRNAAHGGKSSGLVVHARGEGVDASHFALRQKNAERHSGEDGEMEGRTGRGAERLRRIGAGGAADA